MLQKCNMGGQRTFHFSINMFKFNHFLNLKTVNNSDHLEIGGLQSFGAHFKYKINEIATV